MTHFHAAPSRPASRGISAQANKLWQIALPLDFIHTRAQRPKAIRSLYKRVATLAAFVFLRREALWVRVWGGCATQSPLFNAFII